MSETIQDLSSWQIEQLKSYFILCTVEKLGIDIESKNLFIEYIPRYAEPRELATTMIPFKNINNITEHYEQSKPSK